MRGAPAVRVVVPSVLVLALLLSSSGVAGTRGTVQTRSVDALLAAPVGLDDRYAWLVEVPEGASVTVTAEGTATSTWLLTHHRADEPEPRAAGGRAGPTASLTLAGPGAWRVVLDPLAGGPVRVDLAFVGHYGDPERPTAEFTLIDQQQGHPCLARPPGACLP